MSGTSATFLGEGPIASGKGSWLASVRRSYLDYLIKRIDPEAGFAFGFVDAQAKAAYDFSSRHQVSITALLGRAEFEEGDPDIGVNEIRTGISRAWLTSLSWRYLPSPRFAVTQRLYSTGLRFDNDNRDGATLDTARFSRARVARRRLVFADDARVMVEFGGDAERLDGRRTILRQLSAASGQVALNDYDERAAAGSAYGQVRIGFGSRVTVTPGARIDHWSLTGSTTASPWVNAELRLSERTRLRGGSGVYRQFPDLDDGARHSRRRTRPCGRNARCTSMPASSMRCSAQTRLLFNVYSRHETDVLWTPGAEPRLTPTGTISPGSFDAPLVNALRGEARGAEVVRAPRRDGRVLRLGRIRLRPPAVHGHPDRRELLGRCGPAAHALAVRELSSVEPRQRERAIPIRLELSDGRLHRGAVGRPGARTRSSMASPLFFGLADERNTLRLPAYSRLDVRADRAFNWSGRRLVVFVDVANVLNHTNLRNASYFVDRAGRVFETTESLMPIVPSGGFVIEF